MKTILVPTDFSPSSERALDFAVNIAKISNSKIILANAYYIPTFDLDAPPEMLQNIYNEEDKEIKSKLEEICKITSKNKDKNGTPIKCEYVAELKLPVPEINELARKKNVDLIIMGTEGKDKLLGFFGSVTMDVLNQVPSPVLIIKENFRFNNFNRICYAVEDSANDLKDINQLIPFAILFNAEIDIIHIEKDRQKMQSKSGLEESVKAVRTSNNYANINLYQVYSEDILKGLNEFLEAKAKDLIVLIKKERSWTENFFHKSIIKNFISGGDLPLLIIHKNK